MQDARAAVCRAAASRHRAWATCRVPIDHIGICRLSSRDRVSGRSAPPAPRGAAVARPVGRHGARAAPGRGARRGATRGATRGRRGWLPATVARYSIATRRARGRARRSTHAGPTRANTGHAPGTAREDGATARGTHSATRNLVSRYRVPTKETADATRGRGAGRGARRDRRHARPSV